MYEIYLTQRSPHADISKLPDATKAVTVGMEKDRLIYSDTLPSEIYKITEGTLNFTDNAAGSLEITVPSFNNGYSILIPLLVEAKVTRDGTPIWYGRLLTVDEDLWKNKKCVFEGELSYLLDSLQTPQTYAMNSEDAASFFKRVIASMLSKHNGAVEEYKRFKLGTVDIDMPLDANEQIEITTNFENTLEAIKKNLLDLGLDVHVRLSHDNNGNRIIDFINGYITHNASMQSIDFGKNLLDYASNMDGSIYYTVIYPRGKQITHQVDDRNAEYIPTLDEQVYEGVKYYERILDYADPNAEHSNNDQKNTYRYRAVSTKDGDDPYSKGWFIRYDYYRTKDREVVKSDLKKYYTRSTSTEYAYEPVEMKTNDNPSNLGWYEREVDTSFSAAYSVDYSTGSNASNNRAEYHYDYFITKDTEVEYGKFYYKPDTTKIKKFVDKVSSSQLLDSNSKYLKKEFLDYYFRISDKLIANGKRHVLLPKGYSVKAGHFFKLIEVTDSQSEEKFYAFEYSTDDYLNEKVFKLAVPNYDQTKYNPKKNGWYTLRRAGRISDDEIIKDGRIDPKFIKGQYVLSTDTKITSYNYGSPFFLKCKENIISFTEVKNPNENADPHANKWYELITESKKNECVSLVGTKTGMRSSYGLYVDGQTGRMYNLKGMNTYGYIYNVVDFDDADTPNTLLGKAARYFKKFNFKQMTYELSALDLHYLNPNIKSLELLENIYCQSEPHGLNTDPNNVLYFPVTEISIDLLNPENTKYTLNGSTARSLTKSASSSDKNFSKYIEDTKIPSESTILEAARRHADELIKKSIDGSYASFVYNYDSDLMYVKDKNGNDILTEYGKIAKAHGTVPVNSDDPSLGNRAIGIRVSNGSSDSKSTGKWEWYAGGLGYYRRNNTNEKWSSPKVAITMDGSIVCDFLTTGTIKLCGSNDTNSPSKAQLQVYDMVQKYDANGKPIKDAKGNPVLTDKLIGSWGKDGIRIYKGSIQIGSHWEVIDKTGVIRTYNKYEDIPEDYRKKATHVPFNFWADEDGNLYLKGGTFVGSFGGIFGTDAYKAIFNGQLNGNVSGNVTGDVTGDVKGNVNGTLSGSVNDVSGTIKSVTITDLLKTRDEDPKKGIKRGSIEGNINILQGSVYLGDNPDYTEAKHAKDPNSWPDKSKYACRIDRGGNLMLGWNPKLNHNKKPGWNFEVTKDGTMIANKGVFRGTIEAATGIFHGSLCLGATQWALKDKELKDVITKEDKELPNTYLKKLPRSFKTYNMIIGKEGYIAIGPKNTHIKPKGAKNPWFYNDEAKPVDYHFYVDPNGRLYAESGEFQGVVKGSTITGSILDLSQPKIKKNKKGEVVKLYNDDMDRVLIAEGRIRTQGTWIQLCKSINDEDKEFLGLSHERCCYHNRSSHYHLEVESRYIIEAADYYKRIILGKSD